MPASHKVAWSQLRVGIMAIVALSVLAVLIFLMTGAENPFEKKATLFTYMLDSAAMTEGSGVRLNGILIGKVTGIDLTGDKDNDHAVRMTMVIESKWLANIPEDSIIGFSAENVLGAKFLNIRRGASHKPIKDGGTLRSKDEKDFLEVVQSAMPLLESLQAILARINKIVAQVESGHGSIGKFIYDEQLYNRVNAALADITVLTGALKEGKGTMGRLIFDEALYNDIQRTLRRFDTLAAGLEKGEGTAGKLMKDPALYDDLRKSSNELHSLLADLNAGKGTAGKLLKDEALHKRMVGTLDRVNATIDRVNSGQGTLGQLMTNQTLYDNLSATSAQMNALMRDFRANPKKFLTIQLKLF
ncbi:MAG: MCE family protein [Acidobacteria bacterium]|nr:MCE family protein [Acidobacteriota bacterium]